MTIYIANDGWCQTIKRLTTKWYTPIAIKPKIRSTMTVDHFLSKMDNLSLQKQKDFWTLRTSIKKCPLSNLPSGYPIRNVYSTRIDPTKNNNRKIIEYFGKDFTRENNISKNNLLNKLTTVADNDNNTVHSNNYLDKN